VKCPELRLLLRRHVVLCDDNEIHVAVGIGVADGEGALEVRAAEAVTESRFGPDHELDE
jgi:hypothetical protein